MSEVFSYPNSQHAGQAAPAPAAAPAADAPAAPSAPVFSYDKTNQPTPQGLAAEDLPENIRALRDAPERKLFTAQETFKQAIQIDPTWPAMNQALGFELREASADAGFSEPEVRALAQIANATTERPSDEQRTKWEAEINAELHRQYGEAGAKQALEAARQWVAAQSPVVRFWLEDSGLGSHPAFVRAVIEKSFRR